MQLYFKMYTTVKITPILTSHNVKVYARRDTCKIWAIRRNSAQHGAQGRNPAKHTGQHEYTTAA